MASVLISGRSYICASTCHWGIFCAHCSNSAMVGVPYCKIGHGKIREPHAEDWEPYFITKYWCIPCELLSPMETNGWELSFLSLLKAARNSLDAISAYPPVYHTSVMLNTGESTYLSMIANGVFRLEEMLTQLNVSKEHERRCFGVSGHTRT